MRARNALDDNIAGFRGVPVKIPIVLLEDRGEGSCEKPRYPNVEITHIQWGMWEEPLMNKAHRREGEDG